MLSVRVQAAQSVALCHLLHTMAAVYRLLALAGRQSSAAELSSKTDAGVSVTRMSPANVSAMVVWLCHESCTAEATITRGAKADAAG